MTSPDELACWVRGDPAARHRLVALHGLRGTHHGLQPILAGLSDCRVSVPDLPGFGRSPPLPGRHDLAGYVAWAARLVARAGPAVVLLGHSFGSVVAAAVACGLPVRALVLVNPICAPVPRRLARPAVALHRLAAALPERAGTALLRHRLLTRLATAAMTTTPDPARRRWIQREHDRHFAGFADRRVLLEAFDASLTHHVGEFAAAITVPTLLVAGARDRMAPPAAARELAGRFPDARLVLLPDTGHLAHYEAPGRVAAAVGAFLDGLAVP